MTESNKQLESNIIQALEDNQFGSFATIEAGKPRVRYMAIYHEGLDIYLATDRKTHKVEELQANPNVFLLLGFEQGGTGTLVEIVATGEVSTDDSLKHKVWNEEISRWFKGPDDPDYIVLKLTPQQIEYTGKSGDHQVWNR